MDLSKNPFKGEGVAGLCEFLAKPNMLTHLNLSGTECPLDLLFGALFRGCVQHLASINLSGNTFTSKKTKDATVPPSFQQFFSSAQALKLLDMSDCKLPAEAVRGILIPKLTRGYLFQGFEGELVHILTKVASNTSIKHLNLGQNTKHSKSSGVVMEALVQLISEENSHLESISLAESKLKEDIIPLLDAMGTNESVKELDISGNHMGDEGARILAKAVQINSKLRTLSWDKNGTSYKGFADIAAALECNHTLLSMPMPLHDAAQSLKPQTEENLRKIEKLLLRNQSPHKAVTDQAYRLQQGLLLASTQQQVFLHG
ncbi:PREDICTED: leucine-rich repeat-containing protein 16A-like [Acropora digitifera]|uniref:leucine-rich repeat-containing protein 16A-like n=1 Tax=Acropora digitifera TaxID=70779 RepID=UPI00077AB446|nr:PREDICTED: leucine-rich repeat-containing protein 16A-like [Acropora digitifera]